MSHLQCSCMSHLQYELVKTYTTSRCFSTLLISTFQILKSTTPPTKFCKIRVPPPPPGAVTASAVRSSSREVRIKNSSLPIIAKNFYEFEMVKDKMALLCVLTASHSPISAAPPLTSSPRFRFVFYCLGG